MGRDFSPGVLEILTEFLGRYLGVQYWPRLANPTRRFTESEKLEILPAVFAIMPRQAAIRSDPYIEVKPIIRSHLSALRIPTNELIVDLIKDLCDNFDRTQPSAALKGRVRPRKAGIADLRQQTILYRRIWKEQNGRCAICGKAFHQTEATLDHVIPWRLGGDPPDGANWQLLCAPCNGGKADMFTSYMLPEYLNWAYTEKVNANPDLTDNLLSLRTRYLALSGYARCLETGCNAMADTAELYVVRKPGLGFSVFDHLAVLCDKHVQAIGYVKLTT